ncbi:hypothetical protein [Flavobacterium sp. ASV13]|uniref:hypothetical protein n=1 Tax=Flavobacterium sp. ASV13 TaxID=1506583 RepID=UPI000ACE93A9|nr:hypothetical protein [Flavobacterium sp. ASV13]
MRKFIVNSIFFLFPVFLGLAFMELMLTNIPNDYLFKNKYLDENSGEIETLILGSSHTYYGVDPQFMNHKAFNSAAISQSLDYDYEILKKYELRLKKLKYIIIPIDYFSLFSKLETGIESWRIKNYIIYYHINTGNNYNRSNHFELFNGKISDNIERIKEYYIHHKVKNITCNKYGSGVIYSSTKKKDLVETGKSAAKRHTQNIHDNLYFKENTKILKNIVQLANSKNAKVIFITCPANKTYVENLNAAQLYATINFINRLVKSSPNASYYNFLSDKSFEDTDFYDADHLNKIGAKKLSLKIDNLLNEK